MGLVRFTTSATILAAIAATCAQAAAAPIGQQQARGTLRPPDHLPWCENTGGWPPDCTPMHPLGSVFRNPYANQGEAHYAVVRAVFERLLTVPADRRNIAAARAFAAEELRARRLPAEPGLLARTPVTDDPRAALRGLRVSSQLVEGVTRAIALAQRQESIADFERELGDLNFAAGGLLRGQEKVAFYEFTASLEKGYRFWAPEGTGGNGGVELLLKLQGPIRGVIPPRSGEPQAMKVFWKNFIRYACIDALGSLGGLAGGPGTAVAVGAGTSLTAAVASMGP